MWDVIHHLQVERIGHGTHAEEEERFSGIIWLKSKYPWKSVRFECTDRGGEIDRRTSCSALFLSEDFVVTINTDDPQMFGNPLAKSIDVGEGGLVFHGRRFAAL